MDHLDIAKNVFDIESKQIKNLSNLINDDFSKSIEAILNCKGKVIVSGMGKSGIVGKKIAATLASTGTPSFFLHPGEAFHGDLGMIEKKDILILISYSGETDEILKIIPFINFQNNITISFTGNPKSTLVKNTTFHLDININKEVCPLELAPTSSSTATMVMGDALAITLMKARKFKEENFAQFHPGGSLGKRLLLKVSDIMHRKNLPIINKNETVFEIINTISKCKFGLVVIILGNKIKGIITDGDMRRALEENQENFFKMKAFDLMNENPIMISHNEKLNKATEVFNKYKINTLIVINKKNKFLGLIQTYDL